ncbi:MAG: histidine phosphatase family protein [Azospirillaceae bacterium]|nr:histidine phosphatase family protein [Azospirillaceae bacterium]
MTDRLLFLVRHGATDHSGRRRYLGQTDIPLNDRGYEQAQILRDWFLPHAIDAAFCSDLSRSRRTAEIIVTGRGPAVVARRDLREIAMGVWDDRSFAEIAAQFPDDVRARGQDIAHFRVAGGESFADCHDRARSALADILRAVPGNVLVVGHAGLNRALLCGLLGMPLANLFRLGQDPGCINVVRPAGGNGEPGIRVDLLNFTPWSQDTPRDRERRAS